MRSCHRSIVLAALSLTFVAPAGAGSMDWVSDRDIAAYCSKFLVRPDSPSGTVCLSYIQGFLDGLRTTEVPALHEMEFHTSNEQSKEEMHISAVRMDALVEEFGPAARAGVCLPKSYSEEEIVRVIARELRHGSSYTRAALDDYAQAALQERYPCDISVPEPAPEDGSSTEPVARPEGELIRDEGERPPGDSRQDDETRDDDDEGDQPVEDGGDMETEL